MAGVKAFAVIPHNNVKGTSVDMEIKPIVLCKYCKHWYGDDDDDMASCELDALVRPACWFCAGGEMRMEE